MESLLFNKIAGAGLGALLFAVGLNLLGEGIFSSESPAKPGFIVKTADAAAPAKEEKAAPVAPIAERLKTATVAAGEKVFSSNCKTCHNAEQNGPNAIGPNLWGVLGGPAAHMKTFTYSGGMMDRSKTGAMWSYEDIDTFLTSPKAFVSGTKMTFVGLPKPEDRAAVIQYLRSKSAEPMPLPN
ncbi:MAG: cytochrome c family protein [Ancalomicrobiaceae bacterium]|nr:cytochrome c family protein [Ancalomicrobiaceae bacterium]